MSSDALTAPEEYAATRTPRFAETTVKSFHLLMRDGAKIAIDLHLPKNLGSEKIPAIIRQTRYFRSMDVPVWFKRVAKEERLDPMNAALRKYFVSRGYAWLDVDVRGSGASSGAWDSPWSPDEVKDGSEILDFIAKQPWSNGRAGATGNSYDGTAAEMLAVNKNPVLRAIAPRCSLFDVYTDNAYPGGIRQSWFIRSWNIANNALDRNHPEEMVALALGVAHPRLTHPAVRAIFLPLVKTLLRGVRPVEDDRGRKLLAAAIAEHTLNLDVFGAAQQIEYRDDIHQSRTGPRTMDSFSPSNYVDALRKSGVAILGIGAWFDAAYQHAAIKRHLTMAPGQSRLILGPWNHGVGWQASPHAESTKPKFQMAAELLRFFDHHLKDEATGLDRESPVRAYMMGAEEWRHLSAWPGHEHCSRWYFAAERTLASDTPPPSPGADRVELDHTAGSGPRSRWRTLVSPFLLPNYPDRRERSRSLAVYSSPALSRPVELTGHALVNLFLRSPAPDGSLFLYLEEETASGRVIYVTEGQLRLAHHAEHSGAPLFHSPAPYRSYTRASAKTLTPGERVRLTIDLLPTSYRFSPGSKIRLAIAGADVDHFDPVSGAARELSIERGGDAPSHLLLPA